VSVDRQHVGYFAEVDPLLVGPLLSAGGDTVVADPDSLPLAEGSSLPLAGVELKAVEIPPEIAPANTPFPTGSAPAVALKPGISKWVLPLRKLKTSLSPLKLHPSLVSPVFNKPAVSE
jgi:hypothetical protein